MRFSLQRDSLLKPLQMVVGVAGRKPDKPMLANVLVQLRGTRVLLTATDLEVEMVGELELADSVPEATFTLPAKKLLDICKSLPEGVSLDIQVEENKVILRSGKSRFTLSTLPAADFPNIGDVAGTYEFSLAAKQLKQLLEQTQFAMAQQDVRYYLNGLLLRLDGQSLTAVATDGHRLAYCETKLGFDAKQSVQIIAPRKGVAELSKLLTDDESMLSVHLDSKHMTIKGHGFIFTTKLIEGRFPDYMRVFPKTCSCKANIDRQQLKQAISRASILSNEKLRGIRLLFTNGQVRISANNPEQEEAEEVLAIDYAGEEVEISFNASYLLDILGVSPAETAEINFSDNRSSTLFEVANDAIHCRYVVMPLQL